MEDLTNPALIKILKELSLIDDIISDSGKIEEDEGVDVSETGERCILFKINGGSAFTDFIRSNSQFVINISF
mgnify:CR=1 FL=1